MLFLNQKSRKKGNKENSIHTSEVRKEGGKNQSMGHRKHENKTEINLNIQISTLM